MPEATARPSEAAEDMADEELIAQYRRGDALAMETLLERYRNFARSKARTYFLVGADRDDVVQEGMIGLYKAIRDFSPDRETSFRSFAEVCVTRQLITAIKMATRQKHVPLNTYVSIHQPLSADEEGNRSLADVLKAPQALDPADAVIAQQEFHSMKLAFAEILSEFEIDVLHLYVEGKSYQEIGELLGRQVKAVDNALQRIKRKVELHLRARASELAEASAPQA